MQVFNLVRKQLTPAISASLLLLTLPTQGAAEDWRWSDVERVVAVSDVHGAFDALTTTLTKAGVLDEELRWCGGTTHFVITGDILDRGPDSRKVMDLIMRLESEALDAGGRVHLLLGNHEVMNLVGDLRYVSKQEYAAFAADESQEDRERWFEAYRASKPEIEDETILREDFARENPPGFFGLREAFSTRGKYGPWLMAKPLMVVINETAFVHGGLSPLVADLGLDGVNSVLKSQVRDYVTQTEVLVDAGILNPTENFYGHVKTLEALPKDESRSSAVEAAVATVTSLSDASVHGANSPLWYRGNVGCGPLIEEDKLAAALAAVDAERVVIGHTPTLTRRVLKRMDDRVIEIDTGTLTAAYQGSGNALVIEGDSMTVVGEKASADYEPVVHPRRVGLRSEALTANRLHQILVNGEVTSTSTPESGETIVNVTLFGENIAAVFEEKLKGKTVYPDLAAYRLDLMLGLGMVPVTVAREIGGRQGSLQFIPDYMLNDEDRAAKRQGASAWCPLKEQWEAMYLFDALIYNQGRDRENMLYSSDNWQLILAGHEDAFSTKRGLPMYVANRELRTGSKLKISDAWKRALSDLTDDFLREELGDVLDKGRIKAIAKRRDDLLKR